MTYVSASQSSIFLSSFKSVLSNKKKKRHHTLSSFSSLPVESSAVMTVFPALSEHIRSLYPECFQAE